MDEAAFAPGTPEVELDRQTGMPVYVEGEKNAMGDITLTNDRILFISRGGPTGNIVGDVLSGALMDGDKQAEIARLPDVRASAMQTRRMLPDLYVLTLADGRAVRTHRKLRKKWDAHIRRLVTERHGAAVTVDGDGWRAEPR